MHITKDELETLDTILFEQGNICTKAEFTKAYGEQLLGKFTRSIVGLDVQAAKLVFEDILNNQTLNAQQIRSMETKITYLHVKVIMNHLCYLKNLLNILIRKELQVYSKFKVPQKLFHL